MGKIYFSDESLKQIEAKVHEIEAAAGIEVVPVFVPRSHHYPQTFWRLIVIALAVLILTFEIIQSRLSNTWAEGQSVFLNTNLILGFELLLIFIFSNVFGLSKYLLHADEINQETLRNAHAEFLKHEVFKTKNRIGILIHVSLLEKKINIIADSGIYSKTKQEDWDSIAQFISLEFKKGNAVHAITRAIEMCGSLAKKSRIEPHLSQSNELDNKLRK